MTVFDVITLLGGVAFFLFGMSTMGGGLKSLAGNRMERVLWTLSSKPIKGLLLGTLVTAVIQSSSAATIMTVSFVNAGMMKLAQTITVILGAEIGTTATGWILSLATAGGGSGWTRVISSSTFVPLVALIGIILHMFFKQKGKKHLGAILLGFALLMTGMSIMSGAVEPLKTDPGFTGILTLFSQPILGFLAGLLLGAVVQSCSAGVGIVQAISATGVLTYSVCLPLIMGINLGACSPVILSMLGSTKNGRRVAACYISTTGISILLVFLLYYPLHALGLLSFMDGTAGMVGIAVLNTCTRAAASIIMTPFHKQIEGLCYKIIRYSPAEDADSEYLDKLTDSALRYPRTAVNLSLAAVQKMAELARESVIDALGLFLNFDKDKAELIAQRENLLDKYEDKLGDYMMRIMGRDAVTDLEWELDKALSSISDLERLGDHAMNIMELAVEMQEKHLTFSEDGGEELSALSEAVHEITTIACTAFIKEDEKEALKVEPLEAVIDILCDELKLRHVARLQAGRCTIAVGFVFNDLITNCERVADHCSNLGICTLKSLNPQHMPHEYSSSVEASATFTEHFLHFTEKYVSDL
jgi:phosphate:Na+ symporter